MSDIVQGTGDTAGSQTGKSPCLHGAYLHASEGNHWNKEVNYCYYKYFVRRSEVLWREKNVGKSGLGAAERAER